MKLTPCYFGKLENVGDQICILINFIREENDFKIYQHFFTKVTDFSGKKLCSNDHQKIQENVTFAREDRTKQTNTSSMKLIQYWCCYNHYTVLFTINNNQSTTIPQTITTQIFSSIFANLGIDFQDLQTWKSVSVRKYPMPACDRLVLWNTEN